jgi:3-deoxy-D-manno-octulosonic-acid transferase
MLRAIYNALWYPALPIAMFASGARQPIDQRERRGLVTVPPGGHPRIWMHAASVGEVEGLRPLAIGIKREYPEAAIIVTTMTPAGREAARSRIPDAAAWTLAPFDSPLTVRTFLEGAKPSLLIVTETELWPNFFFEARAAGVKVAIINGRITERSAARYAKLRSLFGSAIECTDLVLAQTEADARRYRALGAAQDHVVVTGNTKFDLDSKATRVDELRDVLAEFARGRPILIAASTGPGEEAVIAAAYAELRLRFPDLALIVAPRHLQRAGEAANTLKSAGLDAVSARTMTAEQARMTDALLLDTMGELRALYNRSSVVFVGGSLFEGRGGQSPVEAAAAAVPVLIGPYHEKQADLVQALVRAGGAKVANDVRAIIDQSSSWLSDEDARLAAGARARATLAELNGAAQRTLMLLQPLINLA